VIAENLPGHGPRTLPSGCDIADVNDGSRGYRVPAGWLRGPWSFSHRRTVALAVRLVTVARRDRDYDKVVFGPEQ